MSVYKLLSVMLVMAIVACVRHPQPPVPPLRVAGNRSTVELAPFLVAAKAKGLTVEGGGIPNLYGEGAPGATAGKIADVGTNAETQALRASVAHPDLRIILTVSEGLYCIVAKRSAGITKLSDLKGKRVGTAMSTSAAYFLHKMIKSAGLQDSDVKFVSLWPMDAYKTAMVKGDVDAVAMWEPGTEYAVQGLGKDAIVFEGKGIYRELFNLNTTAEKLADPVMRKQIVAFVAAIISASDDLRRDPSEAQALAAEATGLGLDTVKAVWRHHAYPGNIVPDQLDVLEEEEVWLAKDAKRTPRPRAELAKLIDDSVVRDARALAKN